ncbi:MAG: cytochrome c maturation protein CcmE [Acidobacteria bacterium]|nr:cytochrome c maturation protein CcmE [Acidobacteriota bacterium]
MMKHRKFQILGGVLLFLFAGFTLASFKDTLTPYVSYQQAKELNRTVQVAGGLEEGSYNYDDQRESLNFTLAEAETGQTLRVRYHGVKPGNFEDAVSIVAIGRYNSTDDVLDAEKLLVKCPSKYQGAEAEQGPNKYETKSYG